MLFKVIYAGYKRSWLDYSTNRRTRIERKRVCCMSQLFRRYKIDIRSPRRMYRPLPQPSQPTEANFISYWELGCEFQQRLRGLGWILRQSIGRQILHDGTWTGWHYTKWKVWTPALRPLMVFSYPVAIHSAQLPQSDSGVPFLNCFSFKLSFKIQRPCTPKVALLWCQPVRINCTSLTDWGNGLICLSLTLSFWCYENTASSSHDQAGIHSTPQVS